MALPQDFPIKVQKSNYPSRDILIQQVGIYLSKTNSAKIIIVLGKSALTNT